MSAPLSHSLSESRLQASAALPVGQAELRVALLEDDDIDAEMLARQLLEAWPSGVDLHRYQRLAELEEGLADQRADLLFCDLNLPDAAGLDLLERAMTVAGPVPIVVLSSADDPSLPAKALELGVQDFLAKNRFDVALLARTLRHSLARARADEALRRLAAELTKANDELEECLHIMAHDLRGPLRIGRLFAERLVAAQRTGQDGQAIADALTASLARMDAMVERLLLLASLRDDRPEPSPQLLSSAIDQVATELRPDLEAAGANISVDADGRVLIDPNLLGDLLRHLVENSIKYRSPERPLQLKIWADEQGAVTTITVRDNGIGIAPEHLDRVFRLFERLDVDTASTRPDAAPNETGVTAVATDGARTNGSVLDRGDGTAGLGFGLACCRRIAELHRGSISLALPADGIGVECRIVLPSTASTGWPEVHGQTIESRIDPPIAEETNKGDRSR